MTEYKCPKCGEVYNSSFNYQCLWCLKCNTKILRPDLQQAENEITKQIDNAFKLANRALQNRDNLK
jgi:DNA-directed RNA polymerase subunit RPC12/RpoP